MQNQDQKVIYVLVGPPSVGKSTWIRKQDFPADTKIISSDQIVEEIARENNMTYDDFFIANRKELWAKHRSEFARQFRGIEGFSVVVLDLTNLTIQGRKSLMDKISDIDERKKVAVEFSFLGKEDLVRKRAAQRQQELLSQGQSKTIPDHVMDRMLKSYEPISSSEGFDEVVKVDTFAEGSRFELYQKIYRR
jgi:predicted kinase